MRLAFAISTSVPADIILMDEWMSVGDTDFSQKAQGRLKNLIDKAKILILASNDENLIRRNCNRILKLDHGEMVGLDRV
jgi:lipopolysaccharide transport system ATP-binding protein